MGFCGRSKVKTLGAMVILLAGRELVPPVVSDILHTDNHITKHVEALLGGFCLIVLAWLHEPGLSRSNLDELQCAQLLLHRSFETHWFVHAVAAVVYLRSGVARVVVLVGATVQRIFGTHRYVKPVQALYKGKHQTCRFLQRVFNCTILKLSWLGRRDMVSEEKQRFAHGGTAMRRRFVNQKMTHFGS